jgi:hypothetical protein
MEEINNIVEFAPKKDEDEEGRKRTLENISKMIGENSVEAFGVVRTKDGKFEYFAAHGGSSLEEVLGCIELLSARLRFFGTGT